MDGRLEPENLQVIHRGLKSYQYRVEVCLEVFDTIASECGTLILVILVSPNDMDPI